MERQTRQEYIHDLEVVQDLVATMGDKALDNVEKSMKALLEGDTALAKSVMKADDVIDDMNSSQSHMTCASSRRASRSRRISSASATMPLTVPRRQSPSMNR